MSFELQAEVLSSNVFTHSLVHPVAVPAEPRRGRGRPARRIDNQRVQVFLSDHASLRALREDVPWMVDILAGSCAAQTARQLSTRPLSSGRLLKVLRSCDHIEAHSVGKAIAKARMREFSNTAIGRYTLAATVANIWITRVLDKHPCWESSMDSAYSDDPFYVAPADEDGSDMD